MKETLSSMSLRLKGYLLILAHKTGMLNFLLWTLDKVNDRLNKYLQGR